MNEETKPELSVIEDETKTEETTQDEQERGTETEEETSELKTLLEGHSNADLKAILTEGKVEFKGNSSNATLIDLIIENNLI